MPHNSIIFRSKGRFFKFFCFLHPEFRQACIQILYDLSTYSLHSVSKRIQEALERITEEDVKTRNCRDFPGILQLAENPRCHRLESVSTVKPVRDTYHTFTLDLDHEKVLLSNDTVIWSFNMYGFDMQKVLSEPVLCTILSGIRCMEDVDALDRALSNKSSLGCFHKLNGETVLESLHISCIPAEVVAETVKVLMTYGLQPRSFCKMYQCLYNTYEGTKMALDCGFKVEARDFRVMPPDVVPLVLEASNAHRDSSIMKYERIFMYSEQLVTALLACGVDMCPG